jgi:hypothetical protein
MGVRYDSFGTLKNTGIQDARLLLGQGNSIEERLAEGSIDYGGPSENSVYRAARNNWSGRMGFSYDLVGNGKTILRGGFGIYYDRPFGLLFHNVYYNNVDFRFANLPPGGIDFLQPFRNAFGGFIGPQPPGGAPTTFSSDVAGFTWIDQGLRTPHVQSWFGGVQRELHPNLTLEVSDTGAFGRKLIDSDVVNRPFSMLLSPGNPSGFSTRIYHQISCIAQIRVLRITWP